MLKLNKGSLISLLGVGIAVFLFTNAESDLELSLHNALAESKKLSAHISSKEFGVKGNSLLRAQKQLVSNSIAFLAKARDCQELVRMDPSTVSGLYVFYKDGDPQKAHAYACEIQQGTLVEQVDAGPVKKDALDCQRLGTCLNNKKITQIVSCQSTGQRVQCDVEGMTAPPELSQQISGSCVLNQTYGFDTLSVWVDKSCKAKFKVTRLPHPGLDNRLSYDFFKKMDELGSFATPRENADFQKFSLNRVKTIKSSLKVLYPKYLNVRRQSREASEILEKESQFSIEGEKLTQELVHHMQAQACSQLHESLSKDSSVETFPFSGSYYLYSYKLSPITSSQSHFGRGASNADNGESYELAVNESATFCDFTDLVEKTSSLNVATYFNPESKDGYSHLNRPGATQLRSGRYLIQTNAYQKPTCPGHTATQCLAKKDVIYSQRSPYSFVSTESLGTKLFDVNGLKFCMKNGEGFSYSAGNMLHGYLCAKKAPPIAVEKMDYFLMVEQGEAPPQIDARGGGSLSAGVVVGCLSKASVKAHFEKNKRAMLVSDDLTGLSGRVYERSEKVGKKHYCLHEQNATLFTEENLAEAYLVTEKRNQPSSPIIVNKVAQPKIPSCHGLGTCQATTLKKTNSGK